MNDDLRQWTNGSGRVRPRKHPFTIANSPGEFDDVRPNPNLKYWSKRLEAKPKSKYTTGDAIIAGFVTGCFLTIVVILVYLYFHWR